MSQYAYTFSMRLLMSFALLAVLFTACDDDDDGQNGPDDELEFYPAHGPVRIQVNNFDGTPVRRPLTIQLVELGGRVYPIDQPINVSQTERRGLFFEEKTLPEDREEAPNTVIFDSIPADRLFYIRAFQPGVGYAETEDLLDGNQDSTQLIFERSQAIEGDSLRNVDSIRTLQLRLDNQRGFEIVVRNEIDSPTIDSTRVQVFLNQDDFNEDQNPLRDTIVAFDTLVQETDPLRFRQIPQLGTVASSNEYFIRATPRAPALSNVGSYQSLRTLLLITNATEDQIFEDFQLSLVNSGEVEITAELVRQGSRSPAPGARVRLLFNDNDGQLGGTAAYEITAKYNEDSTRATGIAPFVRPREYFIQATAFDEQGFQYRTNPDDPPKITVEGNTTTRERIFLRQTWE